MDVSVSLANRHGRLNPPTQSSPLIASSVISGVHVDGCAVLTFHQRTLPAAFPPPLRLQHHSNGGPAVTNGPAWSTQLGRTYWKGRTSITVRQAHTADAFTGRGSQKARDDSPGSREKGGGGIEKKYDPANKKDLSI